MPQSKFKKQKTKEAVPRQPWQQGKYARRLKLDIILPYQFLLLCRLWEVNPEDLITDFLDNLSHASWKREGRDTAKQKLVEYCLESGYGKNLYTEQQIIQIFKEIDAIGMMFPAKAGAMLLEKYVAFRDVYQDHWFNQWFYKTRRNLAGSK
jgi:hypothetical protein